MTASFDAYRAELLALRRPELENLVLFRAVDSTNRAARRLLGETLSDNGDALEVLLLAFEQRRGRGRQGREWVSPAGLGVYATLVLPVRETAPLATLPLLVGVGLCRALAPHLAHAVKLKWPNDLIVGGRKLGGVLIETVGEGEQPQAAIVGFGVNHGQGEDELPTPQATSLRLESPSLPSLARLTIALACGARRELAHLGEPDYAIAAYRQHTLHQAGDALRCRLGGRTVEGRFLGFNESGHLQLETTQGVELLAAGEVIEG